MRRITLNPEDTDPAAKFIPQFEQLDYDSSVEFITIRVNKAESPYYLADLPLFKHFNEESKGSCLIQRIDLRTWKVVQDGFFDGKGNGKTTDSIMPILNEIATYFVKQKKGESTFELVLYECAPEEYIAENFVDCL